MATRASKAARSQTSSLAWEKTQDCRCARGDVGLLGRARKAKIKGSTRTSDRNTRQKQHKAHVSIKSRTPVWHTWPRRTWRVNRAGSRVKASRSVGARQVHMTIHNTGTRQQSPKIRKAPLTTVVFQTMLSPSSCIKQSGMFCTLQKRRLTQMAADLKEATNGFALTSHTSDKHT